MEYEYDREKDKAGEPSLAEMTDKAIDILSKNPEGFLLMIEGGRIDHASHAGNAFRTLTDAVALNEAVKTVLRKVEPRRDADRRDRRPQPHADDQRLREARQSDPGHLDRCRRQADRWPRTASPTPRSASPTARAPPRSRRSAVIAMEQATDPDFIQQSLVPLASETHGGEDVGIYAIGPWSHLFQGTVEENYTFHVMDYASKISERVKAAAVEPAAAP